jgi:aldose sugar dehydrogenase
MKKRTAMAACLALCALGAPLAAQDAPAPAAQQPRPAGPPPTPALGEGPWDVQTADARLHVEVMTRDLERPWALAFLPDGGMLVTERPGRLRIIRDGVLDPRPIEGLPPIYATGIAGLSDIVLDPDFAQNRTLYLSYSKAAPDTPPGTNPNQTDATLVVARAKWDGAYRLSEVEEIFVADAWYGKPPLPPKCCGQGPASGSFGARMTLDGEGRLLIASGDRNFGEMVQQPDNHFGKILRIERDGSVPRDNPFVGSDGWKPEIWSTGHRNQTGLTYDPVTGRVWSTEFGPRGGDEVNRIERGANYGWMDVTQGYHYNREPAKGVRSVDGMTDPVWAFGPPSGNPGNLVVYRGAMFPQWQGDLLISMMNRSLVRMKLSTDGHVVGMEAVLSDLGQRFRDVRVGPDGAVYLLTDENAGALLKITPGT